MNPAELIDKWRRAELTERSAAQQHFLDLCDLLDHLKPAEVDPTGERFTFEKGATKKDGSDGWADVPTSSSTSTAPPSRTRRSSSPATSPGSSSTPT